MENIVLEMRDLGRFVTLTERHMAAALKAYLLYTYRKCDKIKISSMINFDNINDFMLYEGKIYSYMLSKKKSTDDLIDIITIPCIGKRYIDGAWQYVKISELDDLQVNSINKIKEMGYEKAKNILTSTSNLIFVDETVDRLLKYIFIDGVIDYKTYRKSLLKKI